ncbi:MAG: prolyl oligopeptidase family serine peptidase, partial [Proteobacteria bacterium]|nr:prolyl oligopeptidase family serine peptidase [Pseudomonadota bacterium]
LSVRRLLGLSPDATQAYFEAAVDSPASALYAVAIADGQVTTIASVTDGSVNSASDFDARYYAAKEVSLDGRDRTLVRSWDGTIEKIIPSATAEPVLAAQVTIERIGPDAIRTVLIRPSNFVKGKRYPVIEHAYGGPHSLQVRASGRAYLEDQVLADALQAVIVRMDTRGTPDRGRDWEKAISRRFGSLPVNEHADTLKLLCAAHPELDADRIGVFGWSYGGYFAAYAVLARPDVYKAGVAGAPPVDWLDYDTAYTERYLGLPSSDKAAYDSSSILNLLPAAARSKNPRPLLIIHGTGDDNVFFFNSLKLIDGLERQGLPYEFLPLMGMTHIVSDGVLDSRRFERTLAFFKEKLGA